MLSSPDMEPTGQTVYSRVLGPAPPAEGLHSADRSTPPAAGPGSAGAERREGQSRRQDQS